MHDEGPTRDPKQRFSNRVEAYARYRPGYPPAIVDWLIERGAPGPGASVVDLGSGTGMLSRIFLDAGFEVTGVEPNAAMREAGQEALAGFASWRGVNGCAEVTGLEMASADLVVSGQAFHWFDPVVTRSECLRILRPPRFAAMIWNERHLGSAFMRHYEKLLLEHAPEYAAITSSHVDAEALDRFFAGAHRQRLELPNSQTLDLDGLVGRVMSSSYAPLPGVPGHLELMEGLRRLHQYHASDGRVLFEYRAVVIFGVIG